MHQGQRIGFTLSMSQMRETIKPTGLGLFVRKVQWGCLAMDTSVSMHSRVINLTHV